MIKTFYYLKKDFLLFYKNLSILNYSKFKFFLIIITMLILNAVDLIRPIFFGNIINNIINKSINYIFINLLGLLILLIVSITIGFLNNMLLIKFTTNLEVNMKKKVFSSILNIPYTDFSKLNKGKLINNVESDSLSLQI